MNFKHNDIIVRCYNSGRTAICIYYKDIDIKINKVLYLDDSFDEDKGLSKYDFFGLGLYKYRLANNKELQYILKKIDNEKYYKIVKKYIITLRKNKLKKLYENNRF